MMKWNAVHKDECKGLAALPKDKTLPRLGRAVNHIFYFKDPPFQPQRFWAAIDLKSHQDLFEEKKPSLFESWYALAGLVKMYFPFHRSDPEYLRDVICRVRRFSSGY